MAPIAAIMTANWLASIFTSLDRLTWWITAANIGLAVSIFVSLVLTSFTIIAGIKKEELQKIAEAEKDVRIADANRLASQANQKVAEANARMEEARANAALAIEGQKKLEVEAQNAKLEQERIRSQNLELQAQVEREKTERLKLQERFAPRQITQAQSDKNHTLSHLGL